MILFIGCQWSVASSQLFRTTTPLQQPLTTEEEQRTSMLHRLKECLEFARARGMTEFAQRFCFNLPDAFASDRKMLANFFQRVLRAGRAQPETHLDYFFFARSKRSQNFIRDFAEIRSHHGVGRIQNRFIFNEITEV